MPFGVVDEEGYEVFSLNACTALVIDSYIFSLKPQLEEFALGDGNLHLSMFTGHLRLDNVIVTCQSYDRFPYSVSTKLWSCCSSLKTNGIDYILKLIFPDPSENI